MRIVVLPGVSGADAPETTYPADAVNVVKELRADGLDVSYSVPADERSYLDLRGAETWLPILMLVQDLGASLTAELIAAKLLSWFRRRPPDEILHVTIVREISQEGAQHDSFRADGPANEIWDGLELWLDRVVADNSSD